jgi:hypothetical protein
MKVFGHKAHAFISYCSSVPASNLAFRFPYKRHSRSPRCQHLDIKSLTHVAQYQKSHTRSAIQFQFTDSLKWPTVAILHTSLCNVVQSKGQLSEVHPPARHLCKTSTYTCSPASASLQCRLTAAAQLSSRTLARCSLPITDGRPQLVLLHRQQTGL